MRAFLFHFLWLLVLGEKKKKNSNIWVFALIIHLDLKPALFPKFFHEKLENACTSKIYLGVNFFNYNIDKFIKMCMLVLVYNQGLNGFKMGMSMSSKTKKLWKYNHIFCLKYKRICMTSTRITMYFWFTMILPCENTHHFLAY